MLCRLGMRPPILWSAAETKRYRSRFHGVARPDFAAAHTVIDLDGEVHLWDFGGEGRPIVLLHGLGGNRATWSAVIGLPMAIVSVLQSLRGGPGAALPLAMFLIGASLSTLGVAGLFFCRSLIRRAEPRAAYVQPAVNSPVPLQSTDPTEPGS